MTTTTYEVIGRFFKKSDAIRCSKIRRQSAASTGKVMIERVVGMTKLGNMTVQYEVREKKE
jgi:hypothetical protein